MVSAEWRKKTKEKEIKMTYLIALAIISVAQFSEAATINSGVVNAGMLTAADTTKGIWLPDVIVSSRKVPADSVDVLLNKYKLRYQVYSLVKNLSGFGLIIVTGIFSLVWLMIIVSRISSWPREPRICKEQPHTHLHDIFVKEPAKVCIPQTKQGRRH